MMKALAGIGIASISFIALVLLALLAGYFSLPDVKVLKGCVTTELYKVNLCEKSPDYTPLDRISPYVIGAIIMSEDASFYSHDGIDMDEIKESAIKNFNEGRFAGVAQQLLSN